MLAPLSFCGCISKPSRLQQVDLFLPRQVLFPPVAMLGKRSRSVPEGASPGKRLRASWTSTPEGQLALRCSYLLSDAGDSNVVACQVSHSTARARDLQRGLLKESNWPPLYVCKVPLKDRAGGCSEGDVAFLLPHEALHSLLEAGSYQCIADRGGSDMPWKWVPPSTQPPPPHQTKKMFPL